MDTLKKLSQKGDTLKQRIEKLAWDESVHQRGKTTQESRGGSFAPGVSGSSQEKSHTDFRLAVHLAIEGSPSADIYTDSTISEIVESHEPVEHFRPKDIMSGKLAGRVVDTSYGPVIIRKGVQQEKGSPRMTMYIFRDRVRDITLIGWAS